MRYKLMATSISSPLAVMGVQSTPIGLHPARHSFRVIVLLGNSLHNDLRRDTLHSRPVRWTLVYTVMLEALGM